MSGGTKPNNIVPPPENRSRHEQPELRSYEIFWRDHQEWLAGQGYMLRPRYKPDWTPSWKDTDEDPTLFEDGLVMKVRICSLVNDGYIANFY